MLTLFLKIFLGSYVLLMAHSLDIFSEPWERLSSLILSSSEAA
jgi:hypothetical protein